MVLVLCRRVPLPFVALRFRFKRSLARGQRRQQVASPGRSIGVNSIARIVAEHARAGNPRAARPRIRISRAAACAQGSSPHTRFAYLWRDKMERFSRFARGRRGLTHKRLCLMRAAYPNGLWQPPCDRSHGYAGGCVSVWGRPSTLSGVRCACGRSRRARTAPQAPSTALRSALDAQTETHPRGQIPFILRDAMIYCHYVDEEVGVDRFPFARQYHAVGV
jgi:hypothetical protein